MNPRSVVSNILPKARNLVCRLDDSAPAPPLQTLHGGDQFRHQSLETLTLIAIILGGLCFPTSAAPTAAETEKSAPPTEQGTPKPPVAPPEKDGTQKTSAPPAAQPLKLPGLTINMEKRCVDVEASICLEEGTLELIACTKDTKEHESIVVIAARPVHIHAALLLLGAKNGNPAMRRALDKEQTRWVDIPARGDLIEVFLEFKDIEGKLVERPITDFITSTDEQPVGTGARPPGATAPAKFPNSFIFAGSQLVDAEDKKGPREYVADQTGDVISIATFGDEVLCLPELHSQENGALMWSIDSTHIPKLGTKVTLRLRPKKNP